LLAAVLRWLGERGAVKVFLEVRRSNEAAIAMYEAAGFATLGVRPNYYRRPTEDAVTMVLEGASGNARK
jgi:ribosomal-protein-alanine N-acetyltransferase